MTDKINIEVAANFLQNTLHYMHSFTEQIQPFRRDPQPLHAMILYATIVEYGHGCLALLRSGDLTCLPALVRSMLEAHVDLINVTIDVDYVHVLRAALFKDQMALLNAAKRDQANPFLEVIAKQPNLDAQLRVIKDEFECAMKGAQKFGKDPLRVLERFKLAGLEQLYPVVYRTLSQEAHNNSSALFLRHLEASGESVDVTFFRKKEVSEIAPVLDAMFAVLITSLKVIREFFEGSKETQQLEELEKVVQDFKQRLAEQTNEYRVASRTAG